MKLIDIHSHILPGLDDGARNLEQTMAMARAAQADGISHLVATPHVIKGVYENRKEDILKQVLNINYCLKQAKINVTLMPGAEYLLDPDLPRRMAAGELLTLNNTGVYLLVELPPDMVPDYTEDILAEVLAQGITPVIAHPERNSGLAVRPELLERWARRGVLAQVTSTSITGGFGREARKRALKYLESGAAQLIASDAHDDRSRAPVIYQALLEVERLYGFDQARKLTRTNPEHIIRGNPTKPALPPQNESAWGGYVKKIRSASILKFHL
jgi:protein-tyrosine phosphatase